MLMGKLAILDWLPVCARIVCARIVCVRRYVEASRAWSQHPHLRPSSVLPTLLRCQLDRFSYLFRTSPGHQESVISALPTIYTLQQLRPFVAF